MTRSIALIAAAITLLAGCQSFRIPTNDDFSYEPRDTPDPRKPVAFPESNQQQTEASETAEQQVEATEETAEQQTTVAVEEEQVVKRKKPKKLSPMTPAVESLLKKANVERSHQNYERAEYYVERALSINPESPHTHFFYSQLLLEERKNALAESRAFKALSLCEDDAYLKRRLWQLIAISRQRQGNVAGSRDARRRAEQYAH